MSEEIEPTESTALLQHYKALYNEKAARLEEALKRIEELENPPKKSPKKDK